MAEPLPAPTDAEVWLRALYATTQQGWLSLFTIDRTTAGQRVDWAHIDHLSALAAIIEDRAPTCDVWLGVGTRRERLTGGKRGGSVDILQLPALWLDVDIEGPNHKGGHPLPPDVPAALELLADFPIPPSVIVHTGGGLQPWWFLTEAADPVSVPLADWGHTWDKLAARHGWHLDNVYDAARILRVPGTVNRKGEPAAVHIIDGDLERRYDLETIRAHLTPAPPPPSASLGDRLPYIGPKRPGDAFNARHTGHELVTLLGCHSPKNKADGSTDYTRPGKNTGTSVTVYPDGHTTFWSETCSAMWPGLEVRRPYDPFGLYSITQHRGDWVAATTALAATGYGEQRQPDDLSWVDTTPRPLSDWQAAADTVPLPDEPAKASEPTIADQLRAKLLHGDAILHIPKKPPLIEGWMDHGDFAVMFGRSGSGKSFVALDIAGCITTGNWWHGAEVHQGHVFYLIAEGAQGMGSRWAAWKAQNKAYSENERMHWLPSRVNLRATEWARATAEVALECTPSLIIIDTLSRTFSGGNENSSEDMGAYVAGADEVRELTGATVMIVHHSGKDEAQGSRGHSLLLGAVDVEMAVRNGGDGIITVESTKQKDRGAARPHRFALSPHGESMAIVRYDGRNAGDTLTKKASMALQSLEKIATADGVSMTAWRDMAVSDGISRSTFYEARKLLLERGLVRNLGSGERGPYGLVSDGEEPVSSESESCPKAVRSDRLNPSVQSGGVLDPGRRTNPGQEPEQPAAIRSLI